MKTATVTLLLCLLVSAAVAVEKSNYQVGTLLGARGGGSGQSGSMSGNCYSVSVQLGDIIYVAAECPNFYWNSFMPHEFLEGGDVEFRIDKDRLCLKRPNGKELRAKITRRVKKVAEAPAQARNKPEAAKAPDSLTVLGLK